MQVATKFAPLMNYFRQALLQRLSNQANQLQLSGRSSVGYTQGKVNYEPPSAGVEIEDYVATLLKFALNENKLIFGVYANKPIIIDPDLGVKQIIKAYNQAQYYTDGFDG